MHRILIVHDSHLDTPKGRLEWAYSRRSAALQKYAPDDFHVDRCQSSEIPWESLSGYDIIFNLDYASPKYKKLRMASGGALVCLSYNSDPITRTERWSMAMRESDFMIVNNKHMFEYMHRPFGSCCISNGVDTEIFKPAVPIEERAHKVFWAGSTGKTKRKNYREILEKIRPTLEADGFQCEFFPIDTLDPEIVMTTEELVMKYNECSYVIMASDSEGTPNFLLEAIACGCVPVSRWIGNIREFGHHGEDCFIAEHYQKQHQAGPGVPDLAYCFVEGLRLARERREELSRRAMESMISRSGFDWKTRSQYFFQLFRILIDRGTADPFSYDEKHWSQI